MDCEKFDRIVLDLLYGELDELTEAAARRHVEHCSRCKGVWSGLRATREVGTLALVDPPDSLELGILAAERRLNEKLPLRKKVGRAISIMAVYAMRPQLAMAALLLLMIGSSLFFLRVRPGGGSRESVLVTERGSQETETADRAAAPELKISELPPAASAVAAAPHAARADAPTPRDREAAKAPEPSGDAVASAKDAEGKAAEETEAPAPGDAPADSIEAANSAFQSGRYVEAQRRYEEIAARGGSDAPTAALQAVEALRRQRGCPAAAPRYDDVHTRFPGTPAGSEAAWQAGDCYRALGDLTHARQSLESLLEVAEYKARAEAALQELTGREEQVATARKAKAAAGAAQAPAAAAPPPAEAKPAAPTKRSTTVDAAQ